MPISSPARRAPTTTPRPRWASSSWAGEEDDPRVRVEGGVHCDGDRFDAPPDAGTRMPRSTNTLLFTLNNYFENQRKAGPMAVDLPMPDISAHPAAELLLCCLRARFDPESAAGAEVLSRALRDLDAL